MEARALPPSAMPSNGEADIAEILSRAQQSSSALRCATTDMKELLAKQPELLDGPLRLAVQRFLVMAPAKKEPAMERVLKLFSSILAPALCDDEDHGDAPKPPEKSFTSRTLDVANVVFKAAQAMDKNVRLMACKFVSGMLHNLPEDAEITDAAWDSIRKALIPRLRDKLATVRAAATLPLSLLQDRPCEDDVDGAKCQVTLEFERLIRSDSSKDVRRSAVAAIILSRATLKVVIDATFDVAPEVREAALLRLETEVHASFLLPAQRADLIVRSLRDRHSTVAAAAKRLLFRGWLKRCDWDVLGLLKLLIQHDDEAAYLAASVVLDVHRNPDVIEQTGLTQDNLDGLDLSLRAHATAMREGPRGPECSPEGLLLLRARVDKIKASAGGSKDRQSLENPSCAAQGEADLDAILPDAPAFASTLARALKHVAAAGRISHKAELALLDSQAAGEGSLDSLKHALAMAETAERNKAMLALQALRAVPKLDLRDEAGRKCLLTSLRDALLIADLPEEVLEETVSTLATLHVSQADYIRTVVEVLSDCSDRAEECRNPQMGEGQVEAEPKDPDEEEAQFWEHRELIIAASLLQRLDPTVPGVAEDPNLMGLEQGFLHLLAESPLPAIRLDAVACLGRLALIGPVASDGARRDGLALKFWPHWSRIAASDVEDPAVCMQAFHALVDSVLMFPTVAQRATRPGSNEVASVGQLVNMLLLRQDCKEVVAHATEGAVKLLTFGILSSEVIGPKEVALETQVLAKLLCLLFNTVAGRGAAQPQEGNEDHTAEQREHKMQWRGYGCVQKVRALGSWTRMEQVLNEFLVEAVRHPKRFGARRLLQNGLLGAFKFLLTRSLAGDETIAMYTWPLCEAPLDHILSFLVNLSKCVVRVDGSEDLLDTLTFNLEIELLQELSITASALCSSAAGQNQGVATTRRKLYKSFAALALPQHKCYLKNLVEVATEVHRTVAHFDTTVAARPIKKFAEACASADPNPDEVLPSEMKAVWIAPNAMEDDQTSRWADGRAGCARASEVRRRRDANVCGHQEEALYRELSSEAEDGQAGVEDSSEDEAQVPFSVYKGTERPVEQGHVVKVPDWPGYFYRVMCKVMDGNVKLDAIEIPEGTDWEMFDLDAEVPERKLVWVADHEGSHVYKDPRRRPANLLTFEAQDVEVPKGDEHGKANSKAVKGAQGVALARRDPNLDAAATLLDEE